MSDQTLCWDCAKSINKGCRWSKRLRPVDGWTAVKTKRGYIVEDCPEFERDTWGYGLYRTKEEYDKVLEKRRINEEKARKRNEQANHHRKFDP